MKKIASLTVLLALVAGSAFAAGVNLSWDNCGAAGQADKTQSCAVANTATLVGSFVSTKAGDWTSTTNKVDIQIAGASMPAFWAVGSSTTTLGPRFTMSTSTAGIGSCASWMSEAPDNANSRSQNGNRIRLSIVPLLGAPGNTVAAGQEAVAFSVTVNNDASDVTGCQTGGCFVFNECFVEDAFNGTDDRLTSAQARQHVTWQGGGGVPCPAATPVKKSTWGSIKAIYR